ncbi:TIGR02646 family protein [Microcoleus sp. LEGE 07076]|uniref:retron system putative HNH endonuclease n=1 Tax=Microcoleus sp. LEGE 07076 TaxID=915322 RepID=UPI0018811610|nr:retron system putative HNH endonuclease [Microcoleus sp. LEGE 07076]MBE9184899.1 TIGR02646 family protein [Microcoleus sp. LEGE 07076]
MKYIQKGKEPQNFYDWKATQQSLGFNYDYKCLLNPEKGSVHSSLLSEQGYICCYCCMRVEQSNSHIEHLAPQSKTDSELSVDYTNMLASCGRDPNWPEYCGNKKQNLAIGVSPLQANCEEFFNYSSTGEILPTENNLAHQKDAQRTIEVLGLNHYDLTQGRIQALEALQGIMTQEEAELLAQVCQQMNAQGRYQPFCNAVLYFLNNYFGVS